MPTQHFDKASTTFFQILYTLVHFFIYVIVILPDDDRHELPKSVVENI